MGTDLALQLGDPQAAYRCAILVQNAVRTCFDSGECAALPE
jgi:hypothetical protein